MLGGRRNCQIIWGKEELLDCIVLVSPGSLDKDGFDFQDGEGFGLR